MAALKARLLMISSDESQTEFSAVFGAVPAIARACADGRPPHESEYLMDSVRADTLSWPAGCDGKHALRKIWNAGA